jgi:hypothetical protein
VKATGSSLPVSAYMLASCLLTLVAALAMRQRSAMENDAFVKGIETSDEGVSAHATGA